MQTFPVSLLVILPFVPCVFCSVLVGRQMAFQSQQQGDFVTGDQYRYVLTNFVRIPTYDLPRHFLTDILDSE